jgi:hypothetical protein
VILLAGNTMLLLYLFFDLLQTGKIQHRRAHSQT